MFIIGNPEAVDGSGARGWYGQKDLADQQRATVDAKDGASPPEPVGDGVQAGTGALVQGLAGAEAGDPQRATVYAGISEEHLAERPAAQPGEMLPATAQGSSRYQGPGKDPCLAAAE